MSDERSDGQNNGYAIILKEDVRKVYGVANDKKLLKILFPWLEPKEGWREVMSDRIAFETLGCDARFSIRVRVDGIVTGVIDSDGELSVIGPFRNRFRVNTIGLHWIMEEKNDSAKV